MCFSLIRRIRLRHRPTSPAVWDEDEIRREWEELLAEATLADERDELNDIFGRSLR